MIILDHSERKRFRRLQIFRCALAGILVAVLAHLVGLGTPTPLLIFAALFGIFRAGQRLKAGQTLLRTTIIHASLCIVLWLLFKGANWLILDLTDRKDYHFLVYLVSDHCLLLFLCYLGGFFSTFLFWKFGGLAAFEVFVAALASVFLLASHRNYHLDAPKGVTSIAWTLGVEAQHAFIGVGAITVLLLALYLTLAANRPLFHKGNPKIDSGRPRRIIGTVVPLCLVSLLIAYAAFVNSKYSSSLSRASSGVGENNKQGESPLGFHSAVGKTKQPAALVRLEGDYKSNPWAPMLYFREGALSEFNGKELVIASNEFDTDTPKVAPGQPYVALQQDDSGAAREEITQSIYLLAKHKASFAIDYPTSIRLIKNPDPKRFELAYQAKSLAPQDKLETLIGEEVGDPKWNAATLNHYLRAPGSLAPGGEDAAIKPDEPVLDNSNEDLRYKAFSKQLTESFASPVEKAASIVHYLSENSVYTRQPGHQTAANGDPVAPYLFAEKKRGYCVHFAHAAVYLMRLAGIPARIGTGYLTDLSYAKDGHILLHLGDRHAWPEVYVRDHGWVVFDITPAQAENEQVIVPDEKLLNELMSKIDPAEDLLTPPTPSAIDENAVQEFVERIVRPEHAIRFGVLAVLLWILFKLWLRYGYLLPGSDKSRLRRAYIAFASSMADLGYSRSYGETRQEYSLRLHRALQLDSRAITRLHELSLYAPELPRYEAELVGKSLSEFKSSLSQSPLKWRRWLGFLSPLSLQRLQRW